jgi:predicted ATPase
MGEPASHASDPTASLIGYLRGRSTLLILDNCEHLLDACAELASAVTSRCPDVVVLATSREPLRVSGETVWLVPPLRLPDPEAGASAQESAEAFRLFVERAGAAAPGFRVSDENRLQITDLCIALAGLPLPIELAATRSGAFTPGQLLSRLEDGLDVLGGGPRTALEHHRTMRAAVDWSYRLLDDDEARLFTQLAVFRGGWSLSDLAPVVSEPSEVPDELADRLASLVDRSLVEVIDTPERRYRLLEPVREFARELLRASPDFADVDARHAARFLSLAREADKGLRGSDQVRWLRRMEAEHDNVRKALRWALDADRPDLALQLVGAAAWFWFMSGHWRESWSWLVEALTAAGTDYVADRATAVYRAGGLQVIRNNSDSVIGLIEETLDVCRQIGDRVGEAWCLHLIGHSRGFHPDPEALAPLQESRAIFDELDQPWEVAWSDRYIGDSLIYHERIQQAVDLQLTSISTFRELGDQWSTAYGMHNAANLFLLLPDYGPTAARPYYERCLRLAEGIGDPVWTAHGLLGLALCDQMAGVGDPEPMFVEAQDRLRLIGDDNCLCTAVGYVGELRYEDGDDPAAAAVLAEALRIGGRIGKIAAQAINLDRLGRVAQRRGERRDAQRLVGAVEAALAGNQIQLPVHYLRSHQDLMVSLAPPTTPDDDLEAVVAYALELAERIAADR